MNTELVDIRRAKGLSQVGMAVVADVSLRTVAKLEGGTLRPTPRIQLKLARAYGVDISVIQAACGLQPVADAVSAA